MGTRNRIEMEIGDKILNEHGTRGMSLPHKYLLPSLLKQRIDVE